MPQQQQEQQQRTNQLDFMDFIDYFNLVEQYMRSHDHSTLSQLHPSSTLLLDDKEEEEEDEEDEDTIGSTIEVLQQRLLTFTNGIKHRLMTRRMDNLSTLFHDDVFGRLKSVVYIARQFNCTATVEQLVSQCYQLIQERYCQKEQDSSIESTLGYYKSQNEAVHEHLSELDASAAYTFEYLRFKCCRELLVCFSQPQIKKVIKRLKMERERVQQSINMFTAANNSSSTSDRYKWYEMMLGDIEFYLNAASDLSLSLEFEKQIP